MFAKKQGLMELSTVNSMADDELIVTCREVWQLADKSNAI